MFNLTLSYTIDHCTANISFKRNCFKCDKIPYHLGFYGFNFY